MKIVKLEAENVKRIRSVCITPAGDVVTLKGENGQGKSSVLDAIAYALGGKDLHPPEVIRRGEEYAQVVVDLGDIIVERRWTANDRSSLAVKSKDGAKFPSPQAMLDKLVGSLSFDPLAFMRIAPKQQADTVRQLVGLDFSEAEAQRAATFERRTEVNRELAREKAALELMPREDGAPDDSVSIAALLAEQSNLLEQERTNRAMREKLSECQDRYDRQKKVIAEVQARIEKLLAEIEMLKANVELEKHKLAAIATDGKAARALVEAQKEPDLASIREKIAQASEVNAAVQRKKERTAKVEHVKKLAANAEKLTEELNRLDAAKAEKLAAAKLPVEGLGFTESGLTLNGLPMQQASSAEQLRVSVAMGLALNPKLKVLLVRDASLLDEKSLAMLGEMAAGAGAQIWLEKVGRGGDVGILIEDGAVEGVPAKPSGESKKKKAAPSVEAEQ